MGDEFTPQELEIWWSTVRRMAGRWCAGDADAQDAAQEVMMRLFRQRTRPRSHNAWLYVVTRRVCHRMRRAAEHRDRAERAFAAAERRMVTSHELSVELDDILRELPPRDRRILEWTIAGVPSREIALLTGCKTRDVGQLVARARRKARRLRDPSSQ